MAFTRMTSYNTAIEISATQLLLTVRGMMQPMMEVAYVEFTSLYRFVVRSTIGSHERTTCTSQGHAELSQTAIRVRQGKRIKAFTQHVYATARAVLSQVLSAQVLPMWFNRSSSNGSLASSHRQQLPRFGSLEHAANVPRLQRSKEQLPAASMGSRSVRNRQTQTGYELSHDGFKTELDPAKSSVNRLNFIYKFLQGLKYRHLEIEKRLFVRVNVPYVTEYVLCYIKIGGVA